MPPAEKPVGRGTCLFALLAQLLVFALAGLAFALAVRGELNWDRGPVRDRVFLVTGTEAQGVGWESVRPLDVSDGAACSRTRVLFLLWKGSGENVEYCECFGPAGPETRGCP